MEKTNITPFERMLIQNKFKAATYDYFNHQKMYLLWKCDNEKIADLHKRLMAISEGERNAYIGLLKVFRILNVRLINQWREEANELVMYSKDMPVEWKAAQFSNSPKDYFKELEELEELSK